MIPLPAALLSRNRFVRLPNLWQIRFICTAEIDAARTCVSNLYTEVDKEKVRNLSTRENDECVKWESLSPLML